MTKWKVTNELKIYQNIEVIHKQTTT